MTSLWQAKKFIFLASKAITLEYLTVLAYPKFKLSQEEIRFLWESELLPHIVPVAVKSVASIVKEDPADDQFLACAHWGHADFLVTGDKHLLKLDSYSQTEIILLKKFLSIVKI